MNWFELDALPWPGEIYRGCRIYTNAQAAAERRWWATNVRTGDVIATVPTASEAMTAVDEWYRNPYPASPPGAAPPPAAPSDESKLRKAAEAVWEHVDMVARGQGSVIYCTGCGVERDAGSSDLFEHAESCAWRRLRAALDAAPVAAPPGEEASTAVDPLVEAYWLEGIRLLRRVEWTTDTDGKRYCPICENGEEHGHDNGCALAMWLTPKARELAAAPPAVEPPPEGEQPFRVVCESAAEPESYRVLAWTGEEVEQMSKRYAKEFAALLNRLFAVRPAAVPAPPAMSEEVRELAAAADALADWCDALRPHPSLVQEVRSALAALDRAGQPPPAMPDGVALIAAERRRQVEAEGWTPEHDDEMHPTGDLARAAACYAIPPESRDLIGEDVEMAHPPDDWPWGEEWWKPSPDDRVRELRKAGALIAAEIDRLLRLDRAGQQGGEVQR